jgi:hypothetical protein
VAMTIAATISAHAKELNPHDPLEQFRDFKPSILKMKNAQWLFQQLQKLEPDSESPQRAHVWAHDMFDSKYKIRSMKATLFFTPRFRNEFIQRTETWYGNVHYHQYPWWFHTAPVIFVDDYVDPKTHLASTTPVPIVLDKTFANGPLTLDEWSGRMLGRGLPKWIQATKPESNISQRGLTAEEKHCRLVSNFRDYAIPTLQNMGIDESDEKAPFIEFEKYHDEINDPWCMMRIVPMYYMQPVDIQLRDCNPKRDPNFTIGLEDGKGGPGIGDRALQKRSNSSFFAPCMKGVPIVRDRFNQSDLNWAYKAVH